MITLDFLEVYHSIQELTVTVTNLVDFAKRNQKVALIIKPHPAARLSDLNNMLGHHNSLNVFVLNRSTLPFHALNCADILITKYSTMGIEAMLFQKPIISLILDKENKWQLYEDAAYYIFNPDELAKFLDKIINNRDLYFKWKEDILKRQKDFLINYFAFPQKDNSELAAIVIDKRIAKLHRAKNQIMG